MELIQLALHKGFIINNKEYYLWEIQRWLREVHDIHIIIASSNISGYAYGITREKGFMGIGSDKFPFETYEEALEEGLIQGLNLIK